MLEFRDMFINSWFDSRASGAQEALFRENQVLKSQIQELLVLDETGFFIELDSLLRAILKKALILCKAESSFFALPLKDPAELDIRISNLILEDKMNRIRERFRAEYKNWQESESELITIDDFILLPLTRRHRMLGIIGLKLNSNAPENVCEILPVLARQAAGSLESAILYEKMFKRLLVLSNVFILGKEIVTNIDLEMLVDKFLSIARDGTASEMACLYLFHENETTPHLVKAQSHSGVVTLSDSPLSVTPLIDSILRSQKSVIIEALETSEFNATEKDKFQGCEVVSTLCMPLKPRERFIGVIQVANKTGKFVYSNEDLDLLSILGSQIAFVIQNADLYRNLQRAYIDTLSALTSAIDAKDSYTHGHSERVTEMALKLAIEMSLPQEKLEDIRLAGVLHDIGKIGIPEQILNKPGRLTNGEFETIKSHPDLGVRILSKVEFLSYIVPMIKHHHERFDGRGYPTGLAGEKIPLEARIISVADTFDAMTSDRPYRTAMDLRTTVTEIRNCGGTQFDPQVVEAFIKVMGKELDPEV